MHKVLFHIDESIKWKVVIANVNNLIEDLGQENVIVEIVANGTAVLDYISNDALINKMNKLAEVNVSFVACNNALTVHEVKTELLPQNVIIVAAGVSEIVKRQEDGYSYIMP